MDTCKIIKQSRKTKLQEYYKDVNIDVFRKKGEGENLNNGLKIFYISFEIDQNLFRSYTLDLDFAKVQDFCVPTAKSFN